MFHCAFHCVTQRRARFTVRFTAFHSAARISLQPRVCRGKFPISNAIRSSSGPVNLQCVCENHPSLERKACKRLTTSLLAQHYERLLRDGLRCRCLIITSNSNSVFSSRASCQNQAHQLGPPQWASKTLATVEETHGNPWETLGNPTLYRGNLRNPIEQCTFTLWQFTRIKKGVWGGNLYEIAAIG